MRNVIPLLAICLSASLALADDAKELPPIKPIPRLLPPKGVEIAKEEREKLEARLATLTKAIKDAKLDKDLGPDVEIYTKAVRWALDFDEFYDAKKDVAKAHAALDSAQKRLDALIAGKPAWPAQRGLLARGYRSDIDDSVQPYGLHIPATLDLTKPVPLLVWLHGRGDKETDLHFIATREKSKGEFAPDWCITLHPYGRGTIGFKFAGEIDVLDAIESVKKRYKIDEDRIALAGFSMGGAGAWHIGAHYADKFCVVHAGAGFVETAKYNRLTPDKYPAWYEQKLWGWYDVPCYTRNLFNVPVIAYSGENDKQKQAADLMAEAFKAEGRELRHIIGPGVEHKYEAKAKEQVLSEIKAAVEKGREKWPKKVSIQTHSLRYANMHWVEVFGLGEHWKEARVDAEFIEPNRITATTSNVACVDFSFQSDKRGSDPMTISIDGETIVVPDKDARLGATLTRASGKWALMRRMRSHLDRPAVKKPFSIYGRGIGLLSDKRTKTYAFGTIDDAFMSPFIVVLPGGKSRDAKVQRWVEFESKHFISRWREVFRGDPRVAKEAITEEEVDGMTLVLWGDPDTNGLINDAALGMPFDWSIHDANIVVDDLRFPRKSHVLVWICPRVYEVDHNYTMWSGHYIVVNSGPTFREGHDRTNSQQTPKLPDWAIIGLDKDPDALSPGEIKAAGFFDENWKVKKEEKK